MSSKRILSIWKKAFKITTLVILGFVVLFFLMKGILSLQSVQNFVKSKAVTAVASTGFLTAEIQKIDIGFPKKIVIEGITIKN